MVSNDGCTHFQKNCGDYKNSIRISCRYTHLHIMFLHFKVWRNFMDLRWQTVLVEYLLLQISKFKRAMDLRAKNMHIYTGCHIYLQSFYEILLSSNLNRTEWGLKTIYIPRLITCYISHYHRPGLKVDQHTLLHGLNHEDSTFK